MNITFYLLPNKVGLRFERTEERDAFWNQLPLTSVELKNFAEKVGALTIRFHPANIQSGAGYSLLLQTRPMPEAQPEPQAAPIKPEEITMPASVLRAPEPIPPIGELPPEVTGAAPAILPPTPIVPAPEPPAMMTMPEISQVVESQVQSAPAPVTLADPEPLGIDKRARIYREWKARQK